jgi:hypothetical protein
VLPTGEVFPVNKGDCDSGATSATGSADAVKQRLLVFRNRVVDYVSDVIDVNASRCNFGRNQNVALATAKRSHRLFAGFLRHVAVQCCRIETAID